MKAQKTPARVWFRGAMVVIPTDTAIVVLTKAQFIEALRKGKHYRRRQAMQARQQHAASARASGERIG